MSLLYKIGNFTGRINVLENLSSRNIIRNPIFASYLKPLSNETKHTVYFQRRLPSTADQNIKSVLGCIGNTRSYSLNNIPFDHITNTKESSATKIDLISLPNRVEECNNVFINVPNIDYEGTSSNNPHLIAASIPNKNKNSGNELSDGISSCKLSADDIKSVKAAFEPVILSKCKMNRQFKGEGLSRDGMLNSFGLKTINYKSSRMGSKIGQQSQKRTFSNKENEIERPIKKMSNEQRIRDKIELDKILCGIKIKAINCKQAMSNIYYTKSRSYAWVNGNTIMSGAFVNTPDVGSNKETNAALSSRLKNQFKPYAFNFDKSRCCVSTIPKTNITKTSEKQIVSNSTREQHKSESSKKYNKDLLLKQGNLDSNKTDTKISESNSLKIVNFQNEENSAVPGKESSTNFTPDHIEQNENQPEVCASIDSMENEDEISNYACSSITTINAESLERSKPSINQAAEEKIDLLITNRSRSENIQNLSKEHFSNKSYFYGSLKDKFLYRGYRVRKYSTMAKCINKSSLENRKGKNQVVTVNGCKSLQLIGRPIPNVGDYDALIKIDSVAISGSDLHIYETGGKYIQNITLGHEASGTVQKIGKCVQNVRPGDNVAIEAGVPCGICDYCRSGKYNLCPETIFNGFFAKYCVHPADFCYKLPSNFNLEDAALIQPLAEGLHACRKGNITLHTNVLIIGACPLGLSSVIFARAMGASNITIIDTQEKNLCVAQELCSDREILVREKIETETIRQILSGMTVHPDVVIDCWGCTKSMNISLISLKPGGTCVLASCQEECSNCSIIQALMKELNIICSFRSANMYLPVINLISSCRIDVSPMITHRFSLSDANSAFKTALMDKECNAIKVIVKCWQ